MTHTASDMTQALQDLGDYISAALAQEVQKAEVAKGELAITVRAAAIQKVLTFLRDDRRCLFKQLMDHLRRRLSRTRPALRGGL